MKYKALVTGATGYIGSKLCQRLFEDGWQVDVILRDTHRPLSETLAEKVGLYIYDGSIQSMLNAVSDSKPDVIFHLASLFIAEHRNEQVTDLILSNILLGTQLIEACVHSGVRKFINTGTSWQHYRSEEYDPVCLYAATKQAFEDILDFYTDAYSISAVTLKLFDTYGSDDPRPKLINLLVKALHTGEHLAMSPGEQSLDLVHISDVTEAFSTCARQLLLGVTPQPHVRYSIASGTPLSVRQLVASIERITGRKLNVTFGERPYRKREVMWPLKSNQLPPYWNAKISLEAGLNSLLSA
jgi:nucleoside-diphosphate-sugar epimerase